MDFYRENERAGSCATCAHIHWCGLITGFGLSSTAKFPFFFFFFGQGSGAAGKGDFLFSSDHLIEMATKLYRTAVSQTKQKLDIEISDE